MKLNNKIKRDTRNFDTDIKSIKAAIYVNQRERHHGIRGSIFRSERVSKKIKRIFKGFCKNNYLN